MDDALTDSALYDDNPCNRREPRKNARKKASMEDARHHAQHSPNDVGVAGYTVDEFCRRYRFGRSYFYKMLREGRGPKIMKLGRLTRISPEADREFRALLEGDGAP